MKQKHPRNYWNTIIVHHAGEKLEMNVENN